MKKVIYLTLGVLLAATFCLADTYNENPDADTWIWPGSGPYGSSTELRTNRVTVHDQEIVMHFDLSSIPDFSTINSATLYAYNYDQYPGSSLIGEIYRVTEEWDEYTLVNSIAHDSDNPYDDSELYGEYTWRDFDVTDLVQEWVDGDYDNYGCVWYGLEGDGYYIRFYSREAGSNQPYLEVDYDTGPPPPGEFALLTPEDGAVIDVFTRGAGGDEFNALADAPGGLAKAGTVILYNPTQDPVDVDVEFTWEESEEAEMYDLICDDDDDFSSPEFEATDLTDETYTYTFTVTESIVYYWTVTAYNDVGDTPCDENFSFEFDYNNTYVAPASLGEVKATFR
jgi:hypothetical protein